MPNTAVDIIFVIIIFLSAALAFIRGFVRESLSLGTFGIAAYLGFTQYALVAPHLVEYISQPQLRDFGGGILIALGVLLLLIPLGIYIRSFIKGEHVTSIDRSFGFLFGAARGYLLVSILYLMVSWLLPEEKQPVWLKEANVKPALTYGADLLKEIIPQESRDLMEKKPKTEDESDDESTLSGAQAKDEAEAPSDVLQQVLDNVKGTSTQ